MKKMIAILAVLMMAFAAVSSAETIPGLEDGVLTTHNYFGEVLLTVTLTDGREVKVKLNNPEPVQPGQTHGLHQHRERSTGVPHACPPAGGFPSPPQAPMDDGLQVSCGLLLSCLQPALGSPFPYPLSLSLLRVKPFDETALWA